MNRTKLPIRERIGNIPQFPIGVDVAVAESKNGSKKPAKAQECDKPHSSCRNSKQGELEEPPKILSGQTTVNLDNILWKRQDQFILSALLGCCSDTIQPSISTALTSKEAWERLKKLYANTSRTRVLTLNTKLMQNPRGNRSIAKYMRDVRSIVDSLALVDNPIPEEDIFLSVITQLGPEFDNIASALRARDSAIGFDDLFDRLQDAESQMKKDVSLSDSMTTPMPGESSSITIPTANYASHNSKPFKSVTSMTPNNQNWRNNNHQRQNWRSHASSQNRLPSTTNNRNFTQLSRNGSFCYYCNRPNHLAKDCRQLQKFLTNFGLQPQANMTTLGHVPPQPWLFDSGASHHVTSDLSNLSTYSDYGGPDVINLGDGSENIFPFQVTNKQDLNFFPSKEESKNPSTSTPTDIEPPISTLTTHTLPQPPNLTPNPHTIPQSPPLASQADRILHSDNISSPASQHSSSLESQPVRPSRNQKLNPKYYGSAFVNNSTCHPLAVAKEPTCVSQATKDPLWRSAMSEEFTALLQNGTWELVPYNSQNLIGCKWIFRIKRNPDGSVERYKARIVAKGFHQRVGLDYSETFAPVSKPATVRIILCLALSNNWSLRQLDINNAFLNGTLHEPVYMVQPPGFIDSNFPNHVCLLRKSIYGLKQASHEWYQELRKFLLQFGFTNSVSDSALFSYNHHGAVLHFLVYVDDIILTVNNDDFISIFVARLNTRFSLKDLGDLHQFLGVEVIKTSAGLFLSQHRHIRDILTEHHMANAKGVQTPLSSSEILTLHDSSPSTDIQTFRKIVGSLQYLQITRPDVSFAVNKLAQFMHKPSAKHFQALKRILRYLKETIYYGLYFWHSQPLSLTAFADADLGGCADSARSTTAYVIYLGPNVISWKSARQKSVSRSSTEAEYKALAHAAAELMWVQNLLSELGISIPHVPTLFSDNTWATYVCANPVFHSRMKHVALDYHFIREQVQQKLLRVHHISTKDQLADILTKPLPRIQFHHLRSKIGVSDGSPILRGHIKTSAG
ncbi:hypothetical protein AgCh_000710 [Apium graveolens]